METSTPSATLSIGPSPSPASVRAILKAFVALPWMMFFLFRSLLLYDSIQAHEQSFWFHASCAVLCHVHCPFVLKENLFSGEEFTRYSGGQITKDVSDQKPTSVLLANSY